MKTIYKISLLTVLITVSITACIDKFDEAPDIPGFESATIVSINQVKALYDDELAKDWFDRAPVMIDQDWAITGQVIGSDKKDGNLYKEGFIEDASSGILLKFESTGGFYLGDSVIINVKGLYLGDYGDFIQLGGIPYTDASDNLRVSGFNKDERMLKVSVNNPSHPTVTTIDEASTDDFLGRLVTFNNVQFTLGGSGATYADALADPPAAGNRDLEDIAGDEIIVRSSGYSTFASDLLPEGNGSITGIITKFSSDYQLIIRDISEVDMTGERLAQMLGTLGDPVESISEDFESTSNYDDIEVEGWQNLIVTGDRYWIAKYFSDGNNRYMQASGYNSGLSEMETWVITQPVTITTQKTLTFKSAKQYWAHESGNEPFELFYSSDYNGTNHSEATWTPLSAILAVESSNDNEWISSGDILLPVLSGQSVVIAFKYTGSDTETTSYRIDDIVISAK